MPPVVRQTVVARQARSRGAGVHLGYGLDKCASGFVNQFTDPRTRRAKSQLTAQQHALFREKADLVDACVGRQYQAQRYWYFKEMEDVRLLISSPGFRWSSRSIFPPPTQIL